MLKATNNVKSNPNSAYLFAFKPRQVVLAEHHRTKTLTMSKSKTKSLTQEQKTCLLHSVIKYLENNALSKTLKRILSEAQIEGEEWKSVSVDLEVLFRKYSDTCNHNETTVNNQELQTEVTKDNTSSGAVSKDVVKKKKKKVSESEKEAVADQSDIVEKEGDDSKKSSVELSEVNVLSAKTKGKKKDKKSSDHSNEREQVQSLADTAIDENNQVTDKIEDKKKKKSRSNNVDQEDMDLMKVVVEDQSKDLSTAACDVEKEKKSSKKRKRLASDENEIQSDNEPGGESKSKKAKGSEKSKKKDKRTIVGGNEESEKENSQVANIDSTKTSKELPEEHENGGLENTNEVQLDHSNGDVEKSGYKSSNQKSTKKQRNGSVEPKTVNAFQRVKIDEVEFADEKLQDNSYWAKSGAEIGYGAKAQEVLGQVKGRDFRHEKTKKKRGSYRGGMIDQQSHSVKFNYSDED